MPAYPDSLRFDRLASWTRTYDREQFRAMAEELPLRRNIITLLTYVGANKVVGTKSSGNMPRKHIRAVTADFIDPPVLDERIGDRIYRLRTEFDVWPFLFIHSLLEVAGVLVTPQGKRWHITELGEKFLAYPPLFQVLVLFSTWWLYFDWRFAIYRDIELPNGFARATQAYLTTLPINQWVDIHDFAEAIDRRTGLTKLWVDGPYPESEHSRKQSLAWDIRRMVGDRLVDFGAAQAEYVELPGTRTARYITTLRLTWLCKALLDGLRL